MAGPGPRRVERHRREFKLLTVRLSRQPGVEVRTVAQISRVVAKQYRDAVGPWEAYLPVLHR